MVGIHWADAILIGWALVMVAILAFGLRGLIRKLRRS